MKEKEQEQEKHALTLYDFYWFHHQILLPPPLRDLDRLETESCNQNRPAPAPRHRHHRSLSAGSVPISSAPRAHPPPKLETIISGQEQVMRDEVERSEADAKIRDKARRRRRERKKGGVSSNSKSLSDLEFEELKGFMDLGFTFAGVEADPRLMSIVPGLQRLVKRAAGGVEEEESDDAGVLRPYLSEAWEVEETDLLKNWRIPAAGEGADMKDHLRDWAHVVASAVR